MTMLDIDQALKELRANIMAASGTAPGILASVFVPWTDAPLHVPLPTFHGPKEPTQVQKVTELFQLGFLLATQPTTPREIEYMLFTSVMWMVKRRGNRGIHGTPSQQKDREEMLQIIQSTPDRKNRVWLYPIQRHGDSPSLGMAVQWPEGYVTPLTVAFWAGVEVGQVQREVWAKAHPGQEAGL